MAGIGGHASQDVCRMVRKLDHSEHRAKHGRMRAMDKCNCGSGLKGWPRYDARGIFLCYTCSKCHAEKMARYRSDVLTDPNYWHDEPIEDEC